MSPVVQGEALLERHLRKQVRLQGGMTIKLAPTEKGVPDRLIIAPGGSIYLVELKTESGRLSPAQKLWHNRAEAVGATVHIVYGRDELDALLEEILPGAP